LEAVWNNHSRDIRIATSKQKFSLPETGLGIIPGFVEPSDLLDSLEKDKQSP
jgi:enoyl-CoA hydratase/carnithine racemase